MSVIAGEDDLEITGRLAVTPPATFNTSNLAGSGTSDPTTGTTTVFYDTITDLISYRNSLTAGVVAIAPFDKRFGYFTGIDTVTSVVDADTELTWSTLSASNGAVASLVGGRINLTQLGLYEITVDACYTGTFNNRTTVRTRLRRDQGAGLADIPVSECYHYLRNTASSRQTSSINIIYDCTVLNTEIVIIANRFSGSMPTNALATSYRAIVTKISV